MAFKIKELEVKCGMTIEINGTWTRIDRGMTLENVDLDEVISLGAVKEQFAKAQNILEQEIVTQVNKLAGGKK